MPGWPSVGRADEHRLSESLRRADADAPPSLYDAYADRLSDYATSLLRDEDAAAEVVHDTVVSALSRAHRLTEPGRLRAWLYALARFHCAARSVRPATTPGRGPQAGTAPGGPSSGTAGGMPTEPLEDGGDPELAALVHQALTELDRPEREVLVLAVRHELSTAEVGAVLGLTSRQAASRLTRARDHLENAAAAVILARTGRAHCPDLSAMVDSWEGPLTEPLRKRLARHIAVCEVCTEGRRRRVSAERLLDMIPVVYAPLSLRRRVIDTCVNPDREAARAAIAPAEEHFDRNGFPLLPDGRRRRAPNPGKAAGHEATREYRAAGRRGDSGRRAIARRSRRLTIVISAVAFVGVMIGAMVAAAGLDSSPPGGRAQALIPPAVEPDADTAEPAETEPPSTPTASSSTARASSSPTSSAATPPATRPASRTSPRPVVPRPRPAVARFSVSCPAALDEGRTGQIQVSASNAVIEWNAATPDGLTMTPRRGVLKAGARARISVAADEPGPGGGVIRFHSNGGARSCRITWAGDDMPSEPPADDLPDASSPPTEAPASRAPEDHATDGQGTGGVAADGVATENATTGEPRIGEVAG